MAQSHIKPPVQRTLILTNGPVAEAAGARLADGLRELGLWETAVAGVNLAQATTITDLTTELQTAFQIISHTGLPQTLAQNGWRLSRINECVLFIIVDIADGQPAADPAALRAAAADLALVRYGLETTATLVTPTTETEYAAACSTLKKITSTALFERGVLPLSRVNALGLELADENALAAACAIIIEVLITTPLPDAHAWLTASGAPHTQLFIGAGAARWEWPAPQAQKWLAQRRAVAVLDCWLAEDAASQPGLAQAAAHWLEQQPLTLAALTQLIDPLVGIVTAPAWQAPQAWKLHGHLCRLQILIAELTGEQPETLALVMETLHDFLQEQVTALQTAVAQDLDKKPAGGPQRARRFLEKLTDHVQAAAESALEKREILQNRMAELTAQQTTLMGEITILLEAWPADAWPAWLAVALRPWRWPDLAWRYHRLHVLGQKSVQIVQQMARLEKQITITAVAHQCYLQFEKWVTHVAGQAEELADMLLAARSHLLPAEKPPGNLPLDRLRPVENMVVVAAETAAAVGGLGMHLTRPDDNLVQQLQQIAMAALAPVKEMHAADALLALWPEEDDLAAWWEQMQTTAVPLWRCDDTYLTARQRAQHHKASFVCGAGIEALQGRLQPANNPEWRWINGRQKNRLLLLNMQRVELF